MSASPALPLRYVLPATALTLHVTLRLGVVVDEQGGHLEPELSAALSAPWHPQPLTSVRRVVTHDGDDPLAGTLAAYAVPGSLRRAFDRANPRTAALIADLSARSEQYLAGLRMGEEPSQVVTFGQALEIVHRELATADRTRREWISRQGQTLRTADFDLVSADMITIVGAQASLPADTELPTETAERLARDFGILVALVTDDTPSPGRARAERAAVAVYRRRPERWTGQEPGGSDLAWVRDEALSKLRLADAGDAAGDVPHPRAAPETDRMVAAQLGRPLTQDPQLEAAVRAARTQLDLLDASDEYSRIASTQYRAEEIAALQHQMRLAYLPRQRSGD
jgi:hypothetical protein